MEETAVQRANRLGRRRQIGFGLVLLGLSLLSLPATYYDFPDFFSPWVILVGCASPILIPIWIAAACQAGRGQQFGLVILLVCGILAIGVQFQLAPKAFHGKLLRITQRADPLIDAIKRYEFDHGKPPDFLSQLAPKYITASGAGLEADFADFRYRRFTADNGSRFWWDLGSTKGRGPLEPDVYPEDAPGHAALHITLNGDRIVLGVATDRLPKDLVYERFVSKTWKAHPDRRMTMARDIVHEENLKGKPLKEVLRRLGPPAGKYLWPDTPWRLELDFETLSTTYHWIYYKPGEHYPDAEPVGRWAYEFW